MGYRPIADYGIIGNDDRCALVSTSGSIDWCCFPTVDSESVFGRLLDAEDGGHFAIEPTDGYESEHRYRERTNVLETTFETSSGMAVLTDFMPVGMDDPHEHYQHAIYRHLRCESGQLTVELDWKPRLDYARGKTTVEPSDDGFIATGKSDQMLTLASCGPLTFEEHDRRAVATTTIRNNDEFWVVTQAGHHHPVTRSMCREAETATVTHWRNWAEEREDRAAEIAGEEPWMEEIVRSGLVLKLLINRTTGGIYAAPTTSLPEKFGGSSNWDYRYNWIRDAKFTVQALYNLGHEESAHRYFEWFRDISHEDPEEIQPVYGVHGEKDLSESELSHLDGHRFSTPVRIGNAAAEQRQLDIYGTIIQGLYETLLHDEALTDEDWHSVCSIVDHVCEVWDEQGAGIWEYRDEPRHYVHSKLLCWVALDRGIALADHHDGSIDTGRWETERDAIREAIEQRGYSETVESFVQHFDAEETIDAACLLIPIMEFLPADDPRVESTIETVMDELLTEEGLVHRTAGPESRSEGPGTFLFCSFWLVDALVLAGRVEKAREIFTNVLEHVDQPYLLAERIDPRTGEFYGNFPQAFSHIGLVNSAIYLRCAADGSALEHDPMAGKELQPIFRS